eukprot:59369-Chlamydomonas_euryale.AAC.1
MRVWGQRGDMRVWGQHEDSVGTCGRGDNVGTCGCRDVRSCCTATRPASAAPLHPVPHPLHSLCQCRVCVQVEDAKRSLVLYGNQTSQRIKDVLTDLHKIKRVRVQPAAECSSLPCGWQGAAGR